MFIYHILGKDAWDALETEVYIPPGLEREGFIHCSFSEQVDKVIERYYRSEPAIAVLEIDTQFLMSRVVNEPSTGHEVYPHVYGPINLDAVTSVEIREGWLTLSTG